MIKFTGERLVPGADDCEPLFNIKMYQEHIARYAFASQWVNGKTVLDVGCGVGYGSYWLAQHGASKILAFDISSEAIMHAKEYYGHPNITFITGSAEDFKFDEKFDVVTCFELIEHVYSQRSVIHCIHQALSDSGVLIISTPRALEEKRTNFHTHEFSYKEFQELLKDSFSQVHFFFENNHFSSLITNKSPDSLNKIIILKDQFSLPMADYFIAVASKSNKISIVDRIDPIIVLNDENYVKLLERDINILHESENNFQSVLVERDHRINSLESVLVERDSRIVTLERNFQQIVSSKSWILISQVKNLISNYPFFSNQFHKFINLIYYIWIFKLHKKVMNKVIYKLKNYKNVKIIKRSTLFYDSWYLAQNPDVAESGTNPLQHYMEYGFKEGRDPNPQFDTSRYQEKNPDVKQAEINPLAHFIEFEGKEGKHPSFLKKDLNPEISDFKTISYDVVFIIGCREGESKRYRVYNIYEGLSEIGYKVYIMDSENIVEFSRQRIKTTVVVLFRNSFDHTNAINEFLSYAKYNGIKVIWDVDDLIFEPDIVDKKKIDGLRYLSEKELQQYIEGVHGYRKMMLSADLVTVPTEYLRKRIENLGKPAFLIPNSYNKEQYLIAENILKQEKISKEIVRIGYFSGSQTHQADFDKCSDVLIDIMKSNNNIILRIVGYIDLNDKWDQFLNRIEKMNRMPYQDMMSSLAECDINLAPLDLDSEFCQGKSELKFFEAGILGIPTIASASDTFSRVIENGINGFCASSQEEWREYLEILVNSSEIRESIGKKAKETSIEKYSYKNISKIAAKVYGLNTLNIRIQEKKEENFPYRLLRIAFVIPGLIIGGGGHRNILRTAFFLSQFGHQISLYFTATNEKPNVIKKQIQEHFYPLDCPVFIFENNIHSVDVVFATHWSTVSAALTAKEKALQIMYFVQDFEPFFSPIGSEYILAENTYRMGLYHITSGPWCENILKRDFNADADYFRFPVDRSIYYPRIRTKNNKNLIFFAKPEMPRRCFELGIMALNEFHCLRPDVEIIMFGSNEASKRSYNFPVSIFGVLPSLDDLARMYSNGDVGLVFSTTNPSLIPYEMMACGLPVVDLDRGDNVFNYGGRRDIALLANPLPEQMALEIARLMNDSNELELRRENGLDFVGKFPNEEEMVRQIENLILNRLKVLQPPPDYP